MKTAVTIGGYALGLLAVFGAAFGAGAVLAPGSLAEKPGAVSDDHGAMAAGGGESAGSVPGDLMVSQDGTVALRAGDLAYLHVHPAGEPGDGVTAAGPAITFFAVVPSAGHYRLYLDFQHQGVVRTAAFTVHTDAHDTTTLTTTPPPTPTPAATAPDHGEGG